MTEDLIIVAAVAAEVGFINYMLQAARKMLEAGGNCKGDESIRENSILRISGSAGRSILYC